MRIVPPLLALVLAAGCGGGSQPPPPPPAPINSAPVVTSAATAAVPENTTGAIYQASATDPDGDPVSLRIEGIDAARFTISASSAISFVAPPDFEAPADADGNNIYLFTLVASDGKAETRLTVSITVTNLPDQLTNRLVTQRATRFAATVPGSNRLLVSSSSRAPDGSRYTDIYLLDPAPGGAETLYLTIRDIFLPDEVTDYGVLNAIAAPDYATSGFLYVLVTNPARDIELRRYGRLASGLADPNGDVIFRIPGNATALSHSLGGGLAFGADNFLYIGVGDGRPRNTHPDLTAQNLSSLRGKILRIDVSRDDFPADPNRDYGIPAGNPFSSGLREIYAYGLDNPRRMSFDGPNLLVGDAHENADSERLNQEINLLRPQDAGANFGYPYGNARFPTRPAGITPPVISVEGTNFSNSGRITGGVVYRGPIAQFNGLYIFSDTVLDRVWGVPANSIVQGQTITRAMLTELNHFLPPPPLVSRGIFSFTVDGSGSLYFVDEFFAEGGQLFVSELR